MNKYILVCFFLAMPAVFAATCATDGGNDLRTQLSVSEETNSLTLGAASTLNFCKDLATLTSCCSTATINAFQTDINTMITSLQTVQGTRDAAYVTLRTDESTGLPSIFEDLLAVNVGATAAIAKIDTLTSTSALTALRAQAVIAQNWLVNTISAIASTKGAFAGYLENRATCVRKLMETQASIMCLSCRTAIDTDFSVSGSSPNVVVPYPDAYKTALKAACFNYLDQAQDQAALWTWFLTSAARTTIKNKLADVVTSGAATTTVASDISTALGLHMTPTADSQEMPTLTSCTTQDTCTYIYDTLMMTGAQIDAEKLGAGGTIVTGSSRLLTEENHRMLAANYDPSAHSAGISTSTVVANPNNVDTSSAWRQGGVLGCVIALVAMLLF